MINDQSDSFEGELDSETGFAHDAIIGDDLW